MVVGTTSQLNSYIPWSVGPPVAIRLADVDNTLLPVVCIPIEKRDRAYYRTRKLHALYWWRLSRNY